MEKTYKEALLSIDKLMFDSKQDGQGLHLQNLSSKYIQVIT